MVNKMKSPRRLIALAIFAIVAMSAFGFAAANTVSPSNAGDGSEAVSGGLVENIAYSFNGVSQITGVAFDYTGYTDPPTNINITLLGANVSGTCNPAGGDHWTCSVAPTNVVPITGLRVISFD